MNTEFDDSAILAITRPHPSLLRYYLLGALFWGPLFLIPLVIGILRYRTLRYQFNDEGVTMSWGGFTHHEVSLAYSRIQDIHLRSNLLERWLGLARIEVQTAGGGTRPELTLEGLREYEHIRGFLYERARREETAHASGSQPARLEAGQAHDDSDLASALREVTTELRLIRQLIEAEQQQRMEPRS